MNDNCESCSVPISLLGDILGDLWELEAEWRWKADEPRAGSKEEYNLVKLHAEQLKTIIETHNP